MKNSQTDNSNHTPAKLKMLLSQLITAIAPEADIDAIDPNDNIREELDLDSIDFIRLLTAIEKNLGVKISEDDYTKVDTVNKMIDYITSKC